ncbi:hypothetical protein AB0H42_29855 [Nocardia sp. NPDC050799]|uniref:hypothetical protein n=1 Tax=Nocardia sp. NPDC050799 TaxID=3154842 RepID=UPI0034056248
MIPFEVNPGELPGIGAAVSAQGSSLASFLQSVSAFTVPEPSVACAPGVYMTVGFGVVDAVLNAYLAACNAESGLFASSLGPVSATFTSTDAVGSAEVSAVGGSIAGSVRGG